MFKRLFTVAAIMIFSATTAFGKAISLETPKSIDAAFARASKEERVPEDLLRAICWAESRHDTTAYSFGDGTGNNHAFGMCQILHSTARQYGMKDDRCYSDFTNSASRSYKDCKLFGAYTNAKYAARYLRSIMDRYDNSTISSIAAYNSGTPKTCKTGRVYRAKDHTLLYHCHKGGLMNQPYVDRVLEAMHEGR